MKCRICYRAAFQCDFCQLHYEAYQNIIRNFEIWEKALDICWTQYLSKIQKNSLTGEWAKEVAKQLTMEEEDHV